MVHIVRKTSGDNEYLSLQKSYHIKSSKGKKRTEHVAYLGRADRYTKAQIDKILFTVNHLPKGELNKLLKQYNKIPKRNTKKREAKGQKPG